MWIRRTNKESGQAIVLIVLAIVALMGFLALSVDVGQAYSNRRTAQNASDASALGGAEKVSQSLKNVTNLNWSCATQAANNNYWVDAANAAIQRAADNHFSVAPAAGTVTNVGGKMVIKYGIDTKNGVEVICNASPDPYVDVHVQLTAKVQTSFMQFVNRGELVNTVDTVVRVRPQVVYGDGATILALKTTCDHTQKKGGIFFDGNVDVTVTGGDVISNSCLDKNGDGPGSGTVSVSSGDITYRTDVEPHLPITTMNPQPTNSGSIVGVDWATLANKLSNECKSVPNYSAATKPSISVAPSETRTYGPGNYKDITVKGKATFTPGLYCIYGTTSITGTFKAEDVTIFVTAGGGDFKVGAGASATIKANKTGCEYDTPGCPNIIGGLAILFLPDDADGKQLFIQGNSTSTYQGTILVPNSIVDVGGNPGSDNIDAQIIGETIRLHGNGTLKVNYKNGYELTLPTFMNLQK